MVDRCCVVKKGKDSGEMREEELMKDEYEGWVMMT
jgi:hypothetical protein